MKDTRDVGEKLFDRHFSRIEGIIQAVGAQRRLSADERQELYSLVMLKVVEDDYAVLRGFQGKSRWSTYLTVIVHRVLLDQRAKEWGRWRPCARARRLGATAVLLDQRINRDGLEAAEAVRELAARRVAETADELEKLADRIPRRPRRRRASADLCLQTLVDGEAADRRVEAAERRQTAIHLQAALASALRVLSDRERHLLGLRFDCGWTVRRIAAHQNLAERPLYRRFQQILQRLRRHLGRLGLGWREIAGALDSHDFDLQIDLR